MTPKAVDEFDDLGARIVAAIGEPAARELLNALTRVDADRVVLIDQVTELLVETETGEMTQAQIVEGLRRVLGEAD
jgi:hypothetical protein